MTVLNYEVHSNLSGWRSVMQTFKNFAVNEGWALSEDQQNVVWANQGGGVYGWDPGDEDFFILTSTGFGSQSLQFRFRMYEDPLDNLVGRVVSYGYKGSTTLDTVSTHPVQQTTIATRWSFRPDFSFPTDLAGPIETTWIFGNDKVLFLVCKTDFDFVSFFGPIGTTELYDINETEGDMFAWQNTTFGATQRWYNKNVSCPLSVAIDNLLYYDGARKVESGPSFRMTTAGNFTNNHFGSYGRGVQRNVWSEVRPLFKQTVYVQHNSDSRYRAIGTNWIYMIDVDGLIIGEELKYGPSDKYITFPLGRDTWIKGIAARIN